MGYLFWCDERVLYNAVNTARFAGVSQKDFNVGCLCNQLFGFKPVDAVEGVVCFQVNWFTPNWSLHF